MSDYRLGPAFLANTQEAGVGRPAATGRDIGRVETGRGGIALTTLTTAADRAGGEIVLPVPLLVAGVGRGSGGFIVMAGVAIVLPMPILLLPLVGAGVGRGSGGFIAMAGGCNAVFGGAGGVAKPASGMPSFIC